MRTPVAWLLPLLYGALLFAQDLDSLPVASMPPASRAEPDWLLDATPFVARLARSPDGRELVLENGLVRRAFRLAPNAACVALDDLVRGEALLRAVRPEANVVVDGVPYPVGGLVGQQNHAFLRPADLDGLRRDPRAMVLRGWSSGAIEPRLQWRRVRHAASDAVWPPRGVHLQLEFAPPERTPEQRATALDEATVTGEGDAMAAGPAPASEPGRALLYETTFASLDGWTRHRSPAHARSSVENEGKTGELYTPANTACFVERELPPGSRLVEATIDVGTDRSASWGPGIALVFQDRTVKFHLRPGGNAYDSAPMFGAFDGRRELPHVGGRLRLDVSTPWTLRLRVTDTAVLCDARPATATGAWQNYAALPLDTAAGAPRAVRVGKLDVQGGDQDAGETGDLVRARLLGFRARGAVEPRRVTAEPDAARFRVTVHYALYDGLPAMSKWIEVHNDGDRALTVDRFDAEVLAVVEHQGFVETREGVPLPHPQHLHVETDFAFGGFTWQNANRHVVHWRTDPEYATQVNYLRQTPCLLAVSPTRGPAQRVEPGATFASFRTFELAYDSLDRERRGLALRRLYRTVAPWVTENPLMMHMRNAAPDAVRAAIDQCAAVGFEMLILSFGSGFDIEDDAPERIAQWRALAEHAKQRGVEIGGYSLLSSRRVGGGDDVVSPPGERPAHGSCPALTSAWGQRYMQNLYAFFPATGFTLLEHDGPYPGDVDVTPRPPLQQGAEDSRWAQWRITADFYAWCRAQGIYVNAPDHYWLNGTSKVGMGYREVNWSLPRDQQVLHTRQNIFDGTWEKTPSLGWMFVPLTEYHGGGAAATIEPLDEHLDHYDRMLTSNLALGVQACYRGPRLYDTERTRELVAARVAWFKRYRDILESDVVHGRRADGRDVDWMLHVNPRLGERGMLVVFNPLPEDATRTLLVDLYYTGLTERAAVAVEDGAPRVVDVDRRGRAAIEVAVPAGGFTWAVLRAPTPEAGR